MVKVFPIELVTVKWNWFLSLLQINSMELKTRIYDRPSVTVLLYMECRQPTIRDKRIRHIKSKTLLKSLEKMTQFKADHSWLHLNAF